jgi:predicted nucleic acid-binding protein
MLVLDASALASWLMPDEAGVDLAALSHRHDVFMAPSLLWAEIRNILVVAERRSRIARETVNIAIAAIDDLGIVLDRSPSSSAVIGLCRRHGLTVYDALYLELAIREGASIATRDAALARAAREDGVEVV